MAYCCAALELRIVLHLKRVFKEENKKGRGGDEKEGGEKRNYVMEMLCAFEKLMPDRMKITITEN